MGKNVILSTILVLLMIATVSDASILSNFRKLAASSPKEDHHNASVNGSPIPNPNLPDKQSSSVGEEKGVKEQNQPPLSSPPEVEKAKNKKATNNTNAAPSPLPTDAKKHDNETTHKENVKEKEKESEKENENEKNEEKEEQKEEEKEKTEEKAEEKEEKKEEQKEKEERKADTPPPHTPVGSDESCDGKEGCDDLKSMTACIKSFDHDSKLLVLLIHNKGDSKLKVDLTTSSLRDKHKAINIRKRHIKQVNVSLADSGSYDVTLNAGNGHCVLHLGAPASQGNFFQQFPSYTKFMTPIYGAYLVLAITLIAGGVFACCCWFRKRKGQRDTQYQELEMSMPESAVSVESAEGWDEVWDDDWDEENAVRSPGGHISANGLVSRNSKKDDWEDWDD